MINLTNDKITQVLCNIFQTDKIYNLQPQGNHTVNHLFRFQAKEKEYMMKILTRPAARAAESFRFDKEVNLLKLLKSRTEVKGISESDKINVPVPEVIHFAVLLGYLHQ